MHFTSHKNYDLLQCSHNWKLWQVRLWLNFQIWYNTKELESLKLLDNTEANVYPVKIALFLILLATQ